MTEDLLTAFEDSLAGLAAGDSLDTVLARYPAFAAELRPWLEAARAATPPRAEPNRAKQNAHRAQFLTRAAELRTPIRRPFFTRGWATALAACLALLFIATSALTASAASVPGDALYPLKRSLENVQLSLAANPTDRWQLKQRFTARRITEAQQLLAQGRATAVEFSGLLETRDENHWAVAGIPIEVSAATPITGLPFAGLYVTVSGHTQSNGAVMAIALTVEGAEFYGRVTAQDAAQDAAQTATQWHIEVAGLGAQRVLVDSQTTISGDPRVGDWVTVHVRLRPDGQNYALLIEAFAETPMPLPSATAPSPTATVPAPTATPLASATMEASHTAAPTRTSEPTHTPSATRPPDATRPPGVTRPPESSPTPAPSATAAETETETPQPAEGEAEGTLDNASSGAWVIGGLTYIVTAETLIEDNPQVGETVRVNYWQYADGTRVARRIRKP